jgi:hypothetical protein
LVFERFYAAQCREAVDDSMDLPDDANILPVNAKRKFIDLFTFLEGGKSSQQIRCEDMAAFAPQLNLLKTTQTCLFCLASCSEHLLACGHSICDTCVRRFGKAPSGKPYHFELSTCSLCLAKVNFVSREELATINPCLLSLDGGGVKGCVALEFLCALQKTLGPHLPLQTFFDLVVGTSSGSPVTSFYSTISDLVT